MKLAATKQLGNSARRNTMRILFLFVISPFFWQEAVAQDRPLLSMDENIWATFYDLPSRRFRSIRDAFVRRDFATAENDLLVAINFTSVEAERAPLALDIPMGEAIATMERIRKNIRSTSVSVGDLDAAFARVHWLLAQNYLVHAIESRDNKEHKNAGRYLWATAHHLERAVLWSDARIDRDLLKALEKNRSMGAELQTSDKPERVYRNRPIVATARTLIKIGEHLDRRVWVSDRLEEVNQPR